MRTTFATRAAPRCRHLIAALVFVCVAAWCGGVAAQDEPGDDDWLDDDGQVPTQTEDEADDEARRFQRFPFDLLLPLGWGDDDPGDAPVARPPTREAVLDFLRALDREARGELIDELTASDNPQSDALFQAGVEALGAGRYASAAEALSLFARAWPEDPRADTAQTLAALATRWLETPPLDDLPRGAAVPLSPPADDPHADRYSSGIELTTVMTLYGLYAGLAPSITYDLEVSGAVLTTFTTLAGFGGTMIGIWGNRIDEYAVQAIENGLLIGGWHGLALTPIISGEASPDDDSLMASWIGATVGGGTATLLSFLVLDPDDGGDIALVNSGALWGTFVAGMTTIATVQDLEDVMYPALLIGTDLGIAALAAASPWIEVDRDRMLVIDLSGMAGSVLTSAIMLVAYGDEGVPRGIFGGVNLLGAAAGLGLAAWLTEP